MNKIVDSIHTRDLNKATEEGNAAVAEKAAFEKAGAEATNKFTIAIAAGLAVIPGVGPIIGAAIAGITKLATELPVIGPILKTMFLGLAQAFGGKTIESIMAMAGANAEANRASKQLADGAANAARAMDQLKAGSLSAADALAQSRATTEAVDSAEKKAMDAADKNAKNRSEGMLSYGRYAMATVTLGYVDSPTERNDKIAAENKEMLGRSREQQQERFNQNSALRNAAMRSAAAQGRDVDEVMGDAGPKAKIKKAQELNRKATELELQGKDELAAEYRETAKMYETQGRDMQRAFENIKKEVERAKAAFEAMNLGMSAVAGTAMGAAAGLNDYLAAQEMGNNRTERSLATLEAGITNAAVGLDPEQFKGALDDAEATLGVWC